MTAEQDAVLLFSLFIIAALMVSVGVGLVWTYLTGGDDGFS